MSIKLNIASPTSFSAHRSGWGYAMNHLMKYHDGHGILLDDFIDITFGYNYLENIKNKKIPYKNPWIGFLHHPPHICPWYEESYKNSIDINIFLHSEEFKISAKYCQGLFVLSDYLKSYLQKNIKCLQNTPIITIKHPTEPNAYNWDFKKFKALYSTSGLKTINIGYFLRNLTSLYVLKSSKALEKILLPSHLNLALDNLSKEISYKNLEDTIDIKSVKIIDWQNNEFYDKVLEQSLVFLDLYDTSCNNAIIESIVRSSPLLINRHPAIEEYLGKDYPLFYDKLSTAGELITYDNITEASEYLGHLDHKELTGEYFADRFANHLITLGIATGSKKITSYSHSIKTQQYSLCNKTTSFDNRFGWQWVIQQISDSFSDQPQNKSSLKLYLNDFVEHVFKVDSDSQTKDVVIDGKKYRTVRGYNLFAYKNSDLIYVNDTYYIWHNSKHEWIKYPESELLLNDIQYLKIATYKNNDWIGFFHNPPDMPKWFDHGQSFEHMTKKNSDLILALHRCKKIFVLSDHLKNHINTILKKYNINIPIISLKHPIPTEKGEDKQFNYDIFLNNPRIIQLGYWMRKMHSFWQIDCDMQKIWLYGHSFAITMLEAERRSNKEYNSLLTHTDIQKIKNSLNIDQSITIKNVEITKVDNSEYDHLLKSCISFVNLYDASANNSIIECIASTTPLLINNIPPVQEYLGKKYPLYFEDMNHANKILKDKSRIMDAHNYLKDNKDLLKNLDIKLFLNTFKNEVKKICKK